MLLVLPRLSNIEAVTKLPHVLTLQLDNNEAVIWIDG